MRGCLVFLVDLVAIGMITSVLLACMITVGMLLGLAGVDSAAMDVTLALGFLALAAGLAWFYLRSRFRLSRHVK